MIRKHNPNDLEQIWNVWYASSSVAHPFLSPEFVEKVKEDMRHLYLPNSNTWVYESEMGILGFISMMDNEIGGLFVTPEQHSKGVGTQLLNHVSTEHEVLEVEVFEKNSIGRAFYDKKGFSLMKDYTHEATGEKVLRLYKNTTA